jgi:hypothetical protein
MFASVYQKNNACLATITRRRNPTFDLRCLPLDVPELGMKETRERAILVSFTRTL